jgi:hypothetical protein
MTVAVAHAVSAGIGLASLPRSMFEESAFADVLCPVLTEHPLRQSHLYAIYVSRKYLPLKLRTFVDYLIERTRIPPPWGTAATARDVKWPSNVRDYARDGRLHSANGDAAVTKAQDGRAGTPQKVLDREIVNCDARTSIDARGK